MWRCVKLVDHLILLDAHLVLILCWTVGIAADFSGSKLWWHLLTKHGGRASLGFGHSWRVDKLTLAALVALHVFLTLLEDEIWLAEVSLLVEGVDDVHVLANLMRRRQGSPLDFNLLINVVVIYLIHWRRGDSLVVQLIIVAGDVIEATVTLFSPW